MVQATPGQQQQMIVSPGATTMQVAVPGDGAGGHAGGRGQPVEEPTGLRGDDLQRLREQVLREAEEKFRRGMSQLRDSSNRAGQLSQGPVRVAPGESESYHSATSAGGVSGQQVGIPQQALPGAVIHGHGGEIELRPGHLRGDGSFQGRPGGGGHQGHVQGVMAAGAGAAGVGWSPGQMGGGSQHPGHVNEGVAGGGLSPGQPGGGIHSAGHQGVTGGGLSPGQLGGGIHQAGHQGVGVGLSPGQHGGGTQLSGHQAGGLPGHQGGGGLQHGVCQGAGGARRHHVGVRAQHGGQLPGGGSQGHQNGAGLPHGQLPGSGHSQGGQGGGGGFNHGHGAGGGGPSYPPGLAPGMAQVKIGVDDAAAVSEALRNLELPQLPQMSADGAALQFGDWLTMIRPLMCDISPTSKGWWEQSLAAANGVYMSWLGASPLQRLRMKPMVEVGSQYQRVEQRGIAMLLAVLPEQLRRDVVGSRTVSTVSILFKLHVVFQPGGGAERGALLRSLTEAKVGSNVVEVLAAIRLWRRWLQRAEELGVSVPDALVLMQFLGKLADQLHKIGGSQVGYRISSIRQELQVDQQPGLQAVKDFAEYLQAEAEELGLLQGVKGSTSTTSTSATTASTVKVAAMTRGDGRVGDGRAGDGKNGDGRSGRCRFWGTPGGCKRADACTYYHDWEGLSKENRCFGCSGEGHQRRDCPYKVLTKDAKDGGSGQQQKKTAKVKATSEKGSPEKSDSGKNGKTPEEDWVMADASTSEGTTSSTTTTASSPVKGEEVASSFLSEAAGLLKALKSVKSIKLRQIKLEDEVGSGLVVLLDGGATHALRKAKECETPHLRQVKVELASGVAWLYAHPAHNTLLSLEDVEPIVPLHLLVPHGYRVDWRREGCVIHHPRLGPIRCSLRSGCPVMDRQEALDMLEEFEKENEKGVDVESCDRQWWSKHFPELPDQVLKFMKGQMDVEGRWKPPWNRRIRRRLETSKGVVLHLFAGDAKKWTRHDWGEFEVLCVDVNQGSQFDLHAPGTWSYVCSLARKGLIRAVLGGPPCRTTSRLRQCQPGPRVLRGRGALRFAVPGLSDSEEVLMHGGTALMVKQLAVWLMAEEVNPCPDVPTGLFMESPRDPMDYVVGSEADQLPSFWDFPEVKQMIGRGGIQKLTFDQGPYGHERRKPTSALSNLPEMEHLDGAVGDGVGGGGALPGDLGERMRASKTWAAWAPGLIAALQTSLDIYLKNVVSRLQRSLRKLDMESWKLHIQNQHRPYRRDCRQCLEQAGIGSPHRRSPGDRASYCLSLDLVGPFHQGVDVGHNKKKVHYIMVASVAVPKLHWVAVKVFKLNPALWM